MSNYPLLERFNELKLGYSEATYTKELPQLDLLHVPVENRNAIFQTAEELWIEGLRKDILIAAIKGESTANLKTIKTIRKSGLILKSAYILLDTEHSTPPNHYKLIKDLGSFVDIMENGLPYKEIDNLIHEVDHYQVPKTFSPCEDISYRNKLNDIMRNILAATNQDTMSAKKFHVVRQDIRHIMNFYQLSYFLNSNPDEKIIFNHLYCLNTKLGDRHDKLVKAALIGTTDYSAGQEKISFEEATEIQSILTAIGYHS